CLALALEDFHLLQGAVAVQADVGLADADRPAQEGLQPVPHLLGDPVGGQVEPGAHEGPGGEQEEEDNNRETDVEFARTLHRVASVACAVRFSEMFPECAREPGDVRSRERPLKLCSLFLFYANCIPRLTRVCYGRPWAAGWGGAGGAWDGGNAEDGAG